MKKYISLLLALVLCLSLCACAKDIELTKDNASKYLNVYASAGIDHGKEDVTHFGDLGWLANNYWIQFNVEGASTNFNYNDVCIKAKVTITYTRYENLASSKYGVYDMVVYDTQTVIRDVEIETDIAGSAFMKLEPLALGDFYAGEDSMKVDVEIIEISGFISPA